MKIVPTTHQFLPEYSAGTEILTFETARELNRRGHEVAIWSGHPADSYTAKKQPTVTYEYEVLLVHRYNHNLDVRLPGQNSMETEYNNLFFAGIFNEYICSAKPDIVHFFHLSRLSASIIDVCFDKQVPCVLTPTDFWLVCPSCKLLLPDNQLCRGPDAGSVNCVRHLFLEAARLGRYIRKTPYLLLFVALYAARHPWNPERKHPSLFKTVVNRHTFLRKRMNQVDRIIVPTRFMENILVKNGLNPGISRLIPFGLNLKPFEKCISKKRHERLQIGFIGSLYEHKGVHVLIEAVKLLHKDLPIDVIIYGNPDEYPDYVARLKDMVGTDKRYEFCGHFKNNLIGEVFNKIDVLVVPSIWYENTPLVIYSAHALGTPVIATNLGGMADVVHLEPEFASLAHTYLGNVKSSSMSRPVFKMLRALNSYAVESFLQGKGPIRFSSEQKFDVILANSVVSSDLAVKLKKQLQIPVVLYVHELEVGIRQFFGLDKFQKVKGALDFIIGSSKMVVDNLRKNHDIPEGKLGLIYDFIPAKEYYEKRRDFDVKKIRNMLDIPQDAFVAGSSGTLDWRKGVDLIPQIARLTKQYSSKPVLFLWIGGSLDDVGMDKLMYDVERLGVSNLVKFIEYDLKYFSILDAFLLPSREDPFPLVCLQAASLGKPILCFDDAGGMPEFVDDECGFVIPYLHVEKVAEKLHELASNLELRDVLGKRAAEKVIAQHDVVHAAEQILQTIDRVIK